MHTLVQTHFYFILPSLREFGSIVLLLHWKRIIHHLSFRAWFGSSYSTMIFFAVLRMTDYAFFKEELC